MLTVTIGVVTRCYRWNHSHNDYPGNGSLNFPLPIQSRWFFSF